MSETTQGDQAQAAVPDTFDLADHGLLAINGMLGSLNPALDYECTFLNILDVHPAYMLYWSSMVSGVMPKYIEALPLLRQMLGSDQDRDQKPRRHPLRKRGSEGNNEKHQPDNHRHLRRHQRQRRMEWGSSRAECDRD